MAVPFVRIKTKTEFKTCWTSSVIYSTPQIQKWNVLRYLSYLCSIFVSDYIRNSFIIQSYEKLKSRVKKSPSFFTEIWRRNISGDFSAKWAVMEHFTWVVKMWEIILAFCRVQNRFSSSTESKVTLQNLKRVWIKNVADFLEIQILWNSSYLL